MEGYPMWDPFADFEKKTFPNGLDVYLLDWKNVGWIYANFIVHSGARQDDVNKEGTAHFVEHLVSENISVTSGDLSAFFKECGGTANLGMTDYLFTEYGFFTPADQDIVKQGFGYMGEIFANNILLQNRIERERNVIIAEILEDHSFSIAAENFLQHKKKSCRNSFLSRFLSVAGSCNSVNDIVQKDLQSYYDTYYVASNMSIVLVGNTSWYDVEHLLSVSGFLNNVKGHKKQLPVGTSDLQKLSAVSDVFCCSKNGIQGIEQSSYCSTIQMSSKYNRSILDIFTAMLNQNLFVYIRENLSATYNFFAECNHYYDFIEFSIKGNFDRKLTAIDKYVQMCIDELVDDIGLFEAAKAGMSNEIRLLDANGRMIIESATDDILHNHRIKSLQEELVEMEGVTFDDILCIHNEFAHKYRHVYLRIP